MHDDCMNSTRNWRIPSAAYNPGADFAQHPGRPMNLPEGTTASQRRKSGEPYITHPLAVAQIVAEELHLDTRVH